MRALPAPILIKSFNSREVVNGVVCFGIDMGKIVPQFLSLFLLLYTLVDNAFSCFSSGKLPRNLWDIGAVRAHSGYIWTKTIIATLVKHVLPFALCLFL
ncbi:hypothetical protein SLE2022_218890 [Rubroshorea leprosula]